MHDMESLDEEELVDAALKVLEREGKIKKKGIRVGSDGESYPVYEPLIESADFEKEFQGASVQVHLDSLEESGLIMKSGKYRPGRDGRLQPVYVAVKGAQKH